jgi:hypothetical protein
MQLITFTFGIFSNSRVCIKQNKNAHLVTFYKANKLLQLTKLNSFPAKQAPATPLGNTHGFNMQISCAEITRLLDVLAKNELTEEQSTSTTLAQLRATSKKPRDIHNHLNNAKEKTSYPSSYHGKTKEQEQFRYQYIIFYKETHYLSLTGCCCSPPLIIAQNSS